MVFSIHIINNLQNKSEKIYCTTLTPRLPRPQSITVEDSEMQSKQRSKSTTILEQLQNCKTFLTVNQVAEMLGFHPETIREYARTGVIPAVRAGYRWRFDPGVLADWLRERER